MADRFSQSSPVAPKELGLKNEDLVPLGKFYSNGWNPIPEDSLAMFRLVAPPTPVLALVVMAGVIGAFFVGFVLLVEFVVADKEKRLFQFLAILIGLLAVSTAVIAHLLRLRYLQSISPIFELDKQTSEVSILGGRHKFRASDVLCILSLTNWTPDRYNRALYTELDVIIERDGQRLRYLLVTVMDSRSTCLDSILGPFAKATNLDVIKVYPAKWFGRGELVARRCEAASGSRRR